MSIKALQEYTYYSRYARYNKAEKRRETWQEATDRVKEMHLRKYAECNVADDIEWAFDLVKQKRVLGSQRALQFGGEPIEKKNCRIYNCSASHCNRARFFQETLWCLLCGTGVGFSVQKHHISMLPSFHKWRRDGEKVKERTFIVPDSIEGWSDALGILIATYLHHDEFKSWHECEVKFDYSLVRPAGSYLASGVGKAPGPEPLSRSLEIIRNLLSERVRCGQKKLRPIDAYDVVMHASDAVLSGGVRRSATICIFSKDDEEMMTAKTGNWATDNPQRARSNNSALFIRSETTKEDFALLMQSVKQCGEPGFYFADITEDTPNPCCEISMLPTHWETGEPGFQFCNLTEINGRKIKCKEDFALAARAAAIIGTLQAGYTDFGYLGQTTREIVEKEALLGVSITGMMDNHDIIFDADIQKEMAQLVVKTNEILAKRIGINPAARCTCIKPSGTTSCLLGSSSGVHPHHARRYFRRVQGNAMESILQYFKKYNSLAVENSVWSSNKTDEVITFCVEVPDGAKTKYDLSAVDLLKHVANTQQNWVTHGRVQKRCTDKSLTHNVSNTINVRPNEWDEVEKFIYENRKWFSGISLLPQSGDLDYSQAPMACIHTPREILQMYGDGALMASGLIVDGLYCFGDLWVACDAVLGLGLPLVEPTKPSTTNMSEYRSWEDEYNLWIKKSDWVRRVKQFAERYCDNDVRKCTYLMKEVNNWKLWIDLRREYVDVDYSQFHEDHDNTSVMDTIACAGGVCELVI